MRSEIENRIKNALNVSQIDLRNLEIKDQEMQEIADLIVGSKLEVEQVFLDHNLISKQGADIISKDFSNLKNLSYLDLQFNKLDIEGVKKIFELKTHLPTLQIALAGNHTMDAGEVYDLERTSSLKNQIK